MATLIPAAPGPATASPDVAGEPGPADVARPAKRRRLTVGERDALLSAECAAKVRQAREKVDAQIEVIRERKRLRTADHERKCAADEEDDARADRRQERRLARKEAAVLKEIALKARVAAADRAAAAAAAREEIGHIREQTAEFRALAAAATAAAAARAAAAPPAEPERDERVAIAMAAVAAAEEEGEPVAGAALVALLPHTVRSVARELKVALQPKEDGPIGKAVARDFRLRYNGRDPRPFVDPSFRSDADVNHYGERDRDLLVKHIREFERRRIAPGTKPIVSFFTRQPATVEPGHLVTMTDPQVLPAGAPP